MNLGIQNLIRFDYLSNPPSKLVVRALDLLFSLGAVDTHGRLTKPLGTRMAEIEPRMRQWAAENGKQYDLACAEVFHRAENG